MRSTVVNIDWLQVSIFLVGGVLIFLLLVLAITALCKTRTFGKSAVSAGIAFALLLLSRFWSMGFSLSLNWIPVGEPANVLFLIAINNLFLACLEISAMAMFFKAIFVDRRPLETASENLEPTPARPFDSGNDNSPLDDGNPYSAPRN